MIRKQMERAAEGDLAALTFLAERAEGKPKAVIAGDALDPIAITVQRGEEARNVIAERMIASWTAMRARTSAMCRSAWSRCLCSSLRFMDGPSESSIASTARGPAISGGKRKISPWQRRWSLPPRKFSFGGRWQHDVDWREQRGVAHAAQAQ